VAHQSCRHFFNSLHLWSVELFMAFMVIHLWGKFWMAAWRGRRTLTWITGVVAFLASVVECFTGYLSQQNFDSQWISTSGKDAFQRSGVGAFFNVMNSGQMLLWHVVLIRLSSWHLSGHTSSLYGYTASPIRFPFVQLVDAKRDERPRFPTPHHGAVRPGAMTS